MPRSAAGSTAALGGLTGTEGELSGESGDPPVLVAALLCPLCAPWAVPWDEAVEDDDAGMLLLLGDTRTPPRPGSGGTSAYEAA